MSEHAEVVVAPIRTGKGQFAKQDEVADLLRRAGAIERQFRELRDTRKAIKEQLKVLLPERGVDKLMGHGVVVKVMEKSRTTLIKEKAKGYLTAEQFADCLKITAYLECRIDPVDLPREEEG